MLQLPRDCLLACLLGQHNLQTLNKWLLFDFLCVREYVCVCVYLCATVATSCNYSLL